MMNAHQVRCVSQAKEVVRPKATITTKLTAYLELF